MFYSVCFIMCLCQYYTVFQVIQQLMSILLCCSSDFVFDVLFLLTVTIETLLHDSLMM